MGHDVEGKVAFTRRGFFKIGAGVGAGLGIYAIGTSPFGVGVGEAHAATTNDLQILGGYPRAFIFRQSEVLVDQLPYTEWESMMMRSNGIMGKVLQEERLVGDNHIEYFTRFKQRHPEKVVLLHFDGKSRRPSYDPENFFAGHWLYKAGTRLTASASANSSDTVLHVDAPNIFSTHIGRYSDRNDDICITLTGPDGAPDWAHAEQLELVSIQPAKKTITVKRGTHGTQPLEFPEGSYLAPHVSNGPWSGQDEAGTELMWLYNYSNACPRDSKGRNCNDALVEDLATKLGSTGSLAAFDGLELDSFVFAAPSNADTNGDGIADGGFIDGVNAFGLGQLEFTKALRSALGAEKILLTDGGPNDRPSYEDLNGIEAEGWPSATDTNVNGWSQGINLLSFWEESSEQKNRLTYVNHKYQEKTSYPVNYATARLVMAAVQFTGSSFTTFISPGENPEYTLFKAIQPTSGGGGSHPVYEFDIYDELVKGTEQEANWLGSPKGPAVHLAEQTGDLLQGGGVSWRETFVDRFVGDDIAFRRETEGGHPPRMAISFTGDGNITGTVAQTGEDERSFGLQGVAVSDKDLLVTLAIHVDPLENYPASIGRIVRLTATPSASGGNGEKWWSFASPGEFTSRFYFKDIGPGSVDLTFTVEGGESLSFDRLEAYSAPDVTFREFENGVVFGNPSTRPYRFDVGRLFPGSSFQRLQGSDNQDPDVNNGELLASELTMGPKDGLFVRRIVVAAAPVTVQYVDQKGNAVAPALTLTGTLGAVYGAVPAMPDGYRLVATPGNAKGTFADQPITVTFVYERVSTSSPGGGGSGSSPTQGRGTGKLANTGSDTVEIGALAAGVASTGAAALIARRLRSRGSREEDAAESSTE